MTPGRLLPLRLSRWWPLAESFGAVYGLDPLLLLAVMDRESRGGEALIPPNPTGVGDHGHGRGLMQIDDRPAGGHVPFLEMKSRDGVPLWMLPEHNIQYGASVLAAAIRSFDGLLAPGIAAYNAGHRTVARAIAELSHPYDPVALLKACDSVTAGGDYVSDVLRRRESFTIPRGPQEST